MTAAAANGVMQPADTPDAHLTFALAAAQAEFPTIDKAHTAEVRGKDGKPGYKYTYADLADVLAAVRPVLSRNGLAIIQRTSLHDGQVILLTELRHIAGGIVSSEINLSHPTNNPQQFGGALTYLRRYELVTLLGIAAEEDRDAQNIEPAPRREQRRTPEPKPEPRASDEDRERITSAAAASSLTPPDFANLLRSTVGQQPLTFDGDQPALDFARRFIERMPARLADPVLTAIEDSRLAYALDEVVARGLWDERRRAMELVTHDAKDASSVQAALASMPAEKKASLRAELDDLLLGAQA